MKQILTTAILVAALVYNAAAQDFKQQFRELVAKKDTAAQAVLLKQWEAADSNDPEMFIAHFNFYVTQSRMSVLALGKDPEGETVLQLMNTDTSAQQPAGYLYESTYYDPVLLKKGFDYAERGIEKNPARLDIRFGKIYMLGELKNYKDFTAEIIKTVDYSAVINNHWFWADNEPLEDPQVFMLGSIQTYQLQLYNTNDDALLDNMQQIAEAILKYYPDHVESLSNLSIVHLLKKEYDKALAALLKAETLAPEDFIVLINIAQAYKLKGDNQNAILYYEKTLKYGDASAKEYAKEQIEELSKK